MKKIAIDFGTTNTVVAVWREALSAPETLRLPGLSAPADDGLPALIPSTLYVSDGGSGKVIVGHEIHELGLDTQGDERYFSSFKRGIAASTRPLARTIDGTEWDDSRAAQAFLSRVLSAVVEQEQGSIDELVATVPIQSFERYLKWLRDEAVRAGPAIQRLRIIDESTAAALGYNIRSPGELVFVFDFGGGTLDVSLVRMPFSDEGRGVVMDPDSVTQTESARRISVASPEARVIAKAGRALGGDDIDHWLLEELLERSNASRADVGDAYAQMKKAVEAAKIRLSTFETAEISVFDPDTYRTFHTTFTRSQLEEILDKREFFGAIQKTLDKILRSARASGIYPEDINAVLLIGGTSMMPSVKRTLRAMFPVERVYENKPFEAVAHGALGLAMGIGVDDFLYHSYGVRHLSPISGRHEWEEIIPSGVRYPLGDPVKLVLTASRDGQEALELVIGEVEESAGGVTEVMFGDRAILMVEGGMELRRVLPLNDNDGARTVALLDPPGRVGEDRVEVEFTVDQNRMLRVTVSDLQSKRVLLRDAPVVELR